VRVWSLDAAFPAGVGPTGLVCGVRVGKIENPLMQRSRHLDRLVDEPAKGEPMAEVLRA